MTVVYKEIECEVVWGTETFPWSGEVLKGFVVEYDFIRAHRELGGQRRWVRVWYEPIEDEK
jgi:hypothetical protein